MLNKLQSFTESIGFISGFIGSVILLSTFTNENATVAYLTIILIGMLIINSDKFTNLLKKEGNKNVKSV